MIYLKAGDAGRRFHCFIYTICCLLLFLAPPHVSHGAAPGDANNDGKISRADVTTVIDHILGATAPGNPDCNTDSVVNVQDVICLINILSTLPPPDPGEVAPPIDPTVATTVAGATEFIYTGSNPIQTGVAAGTIEPRRVAVLRGKVMDRDENPLPLVNLTILNHPEYGQTKSRDDGMFDMAVNGGGFLTVNYEKSGYLPAQRQVSVPWQDYVWLPDVILIPVDTQVTPIDLTNPDPLQVARGSVVTDNAGSRQATLLFPQGTTATLVKADGITQGITTLSVRATEYTVGSNGPKAMPAELPPTSGYTYCVELTADEVAAAGAVDVRFDKPLWFYLEDFIGFPVGSAVPTGYYDRQRGQWIASQNGRVLKIVAITGDLADLDTDGDGVADAVDQLSALVRDFINTITYSPQRHRER